MHNYDPLAPNLSKIAGLSIGNIKRLLKGHIGRPKPNVEPQLLRASLGPANVKAAIRNQLDMWRNVVPRSVADRLSRVESQQDLINALREAAKRHNEAVDVMHRMGAGESPYSIRRYNRVAHIASVRGNMYELVSRALKNLGVNPEKIAKLKEI